MKIFISWSGPRSKQLAEALNEWIPEVIQTTECFYSSEAIRAGQRWSNEINEQLSATDFGVLCITPENMRAPWLNFEAGALSKKLGDGTRVVPVTLGFPPARVEEPLKQFNGVEAHRTGIKSLVQSIAEAAGSKINVDRIFDKFWPDLEGKISAIPKSDDDVALPNPPDTNELLEEIRDIVLGIARDQKATSVPGDASPQRTTALATLAVALAREAQLRDVSDMFPSIKFDRQGEPSRYDRQQWRELKLEELQHEADLDAAMEADDEDLDTEPK